jgi:hypothetical protein
MHQAMTQQGFDPIAALMSDLRGERMSTEQKQGESAGSAHTPGPWQAKRGTIVGEAGAGRIVAILDTVDEHDDANARLIAAAPELLEAARMLEPLLASDKSNDWNEELVTLRAGIAKAEGRTK